MNFNENAVVLNEYLSWLKAWLTYRLQQYFRANGDGSALSPEQAEKNESAFEDKEKFATPAPPLVSFPDAPLPLFISKHTLTTNEQLLLLLSLAPHVNPVFLDEIIHQYIPAKGDFPQLGGTRGVQFRGFLPTGETTLFLLAGNELADRLKTKQLFNEEHLFAKYQVLWLDNVGEKEPAMSARLILSQEYIDLFLTGNYTKPKFGIDFPAEEITTPLDWQDLVLNEDTMEQVQELKKWLRHKTDLQKINKRLKPGYRALFYGPPGTGKTLTACLLGKSDGSDNAAYSVYRVDLSQVVSKYIGETEKNLSKLFDKAEHKNWILFFDEADAIFGKRTNVRDAHDKYANQEVSYLLQRVEQYNGLVILASNFKSNIDPAFSRRFQSVIQFSMPTAKERLSLWKMILPDHMAGEDNVLEYISFKYEISGASIINIAQSCFLKNLSGDGMISKVTKLDIEQGIAREFNKEGKILK